MFTPGGEWTSNCSNLFIPTSFDLEQASVQPKRMMYSTPMDTIQVEFDEHNKPDDHLVRYVCARSLPSYISRQWENHLFVVT